MNGYIDGNLRINDIDPLDPFEYKFVSHYIGVLLQDPEKQISMPTPWDEISFVLENLGYSYEEIRRRTNDALNKIHLLNKAFHDIEYLSGGEKRKVIFAASTIHDPQNILLDEPSASIDPWGIRDIREFIYENKIRGRTIIIVEHKPYYFMRYVDRIVIIDKGEMKKIIDNDKGSITQRFDKESYLENIQEKLSLIDKKLNTGKKGSKILELKDLCVGYGEDTLIKDVNLDLYEKEIVALVGANGSGKTTLLKTLLGWIKPLSGQIIISGKEIPMSKKRRVIRDVFYIPQQPDYLFIRSTVKSELREFINDPRDLLVIEELFPWYNETLHKSPYKLSHGQRRWLSILIGILSNRKILLLDEPTAGLDEKLYDKLIKMLRDLVERYNRSIIISTHDLRVIIDLADRIYYVDKDRRIMREVSHEEIVSLYGGLLGE